MSYWYVWTDFGGVLTPPIGDTLDVFCRNHNLTTAELRHAMQRIASKYAVSDPLEPIDRPIVAESVWLAELNSELGGKLPLTTLANVWFDGRPTNLDWLEALREFRSKGARIGMLSNMVPTWDRHWRQMVNSNDMFDHIVLSFEVGFRKPESALFSYAERQAGVQPRQCVLVDDLEQNCEGAIACGWNAVHFQDADSARRELLRIIS